MALQVVRVLVVRLQQQALRWTAGAAPHRTGRSQQATAPGQTLVRADSKPCIDGFTVQECGPVLPPIQQNVLQHAGFGSLAQSHALLKQLLLLLRLGSKREAVRGPLLDALLAYLQACRGPRIVHASADLFQAAISGQTAAPATLFLLAPIMTNTIALYHWHPHC